MKHITTNLIRKVKQHPFFHGVDWKQVYQQNYAPPFIPPKGEVNAADACDIGNFDEDDTKAVKITDQDQEIYRDFSLTISERFEHLFKDIFDSKLTSLFI